MASEKTLGCGRRRNAYAAAHLVLRREISLVKGAPRRAEEAQFEQSRSRREADDSIRVNPRAGFGSVSDTDDSGRGGPTASLSTTSIATPSSFSALSHNVSDMEFSEA
jgi:hypothetical protein